MCIAQYSANTETVDNEANYYSIFFMILNHVNIKVI